VVEILPPAQGNPRRAGRIAETVAMSQAIIDPEEVRRFAAELKRFNNEVKERTSSLMSRFAALGDSWQDQEHEKFSAEFLQMMKTMKRFIELSDQHAPYLLRKADRIQQYLDQR
jgi:WXG100 family type VII secretion target